MHLAHVEICMSGTGIGEVPSNVLDLSNGKGRSKAGNCAERQTCLASMARN